MVVGLSLSFEILFDLIGNWFSFVNEIDDLSIMRIGNDFGNGVAYSRMQ